MESRYEKNSIPFVKCIFGDCKLFSRLRSLHFDGERALVEPTGWARGVRESRIAALRAAR